MSDNDTQRSARGTKWSKTECKRRRETCRSRKIESVRVVCETKRQLGNEKSKGKERKRVKSKRKGDGEETGDPVSLGTKRKKDGDEDGRRKKKGLKIGEN